MPFTLPTAEDFATRFPIFGDADPELVTLLLAEASGMVDQSWQEADYQPAILYLTAHLLASDSSQEGDDVGSGGEGIIASESFGGMSVSYVRANAGNSSAFNSEYSTTSYGRRFLKLLRMNKPGVVSI